MITPPRIQKIDIVLTRRYPDDRVLRLERGPGGAVPGEAYPERISLPLLNKYKGIQKARREDRKWRWINFGLKPSFETLVNDPTGTSCTDSAPKAGRRSIPGGDSACLARSRVTRSTISNRPWTLCRTLSGATSSSTSPELQYGQASGRADRQDGSSDLRQDGRWISGSGVRGLDGEVAMPLLGGRFLVGLGGSAVRKRDPDNPFLLRTDDTKLYYTGFFNTRSTSPRSHVG